MLVYLDMCCLKRPFDDQTQPRIRLEAEAVLGLLAAESAALRFVRSAALVLENQQNPIRQRAARVEQWLTEEPTWRPVATEIQNRVAELIQMGLKSFDALHVASAEQAGADVMATCDDRLVDACRRHAAQLNVRVASVLDLAAEVLK
jgi:predicted nucleic acid-binding protein